MSQNSARVLWMQQMVSHCFNTQGETTRITDKDLTAIFQVKMIDYYALGSFIVDNVYLYKPAALNPGTAVENTQVDVQSHKLIRNGVLYIIRNGVTYDVMGRIVR